ncbi:DNA ligase D [Variovorax sp. Root411]|uniref:DNA ligase D n=1 Tax=Variovorax sp. Root411 TaxID=1736530 RepID=UPI0006F391F1|nr:DNA ligase D [Variovorax sp. Root411]KQW59271.1 ATP-dependent DNA ligase [Variovorax sp. Root411]
MGTATASTARKALERYLGKRDFSRTPEPKAGGRQGRGVLSFVIQKHHASHLHYDFRLELDGTLKSWAVPKGPCLDPSVKRMAVHVEDHPISYADFEGTIPPKQYGAGTVIVWDRGDWLPDGDARKSLAAGKLKFELRGEKLHGHWTLVRMHGKGDEKHEPWLLIKERDGEARAIGEYDVVEEQPASVITGRGVDEVDQAPRKVATKAAPVKKAEKKTTKKSPLPATFLPQLATLAASPPSSPGDWLYELKFDGYRLLARIDKGKVRCFTRNGHDWTAKLSALEEALAKLPTASAWLDGEITVEGENGAPDFQALQNAFDRGKTSSIVYWLFDAPFLDGEDLRDRPVEERRARLAKLLGRKPPAPLRMSEAFDASPRDLLASSAQLGYEGIVGKRKGSPYVSRRSPDWIKLKNQQRQEFVIGGFTAPKGSRTGFGALLLGVHHEATGRLRYCGNVGTGFDADRLTDIKARLDKLVTDACPFEPAPRGVRAQWVKPTLVAEISFGEWTREDRVRQAVFQGLRADKPARDIRRERPQRAREIEAAPKPNNEQAKAPMTLKITHADRVIDKHSGITKGELAVYYDSVAKLMLPHLRGRPVSLVRAPEGVGGELFFQKHMQNSEIAGLRLLDPALDPGHDPLLQIDTKQGLLGAAQMNVIELHTWNATSRAIGKPDRMTFDLDPGEGVAWPQIQEAATLVRTLLEELGLPSFLKTSGGKGLHVVVPLRRQYDWDTVRGFSQAVVKHLAQAIPDRFAAKSGPRNRVGKVFVDYLRNGFGATTVSAWSARSRPGLGVSVPLAWDELPALTSAAQWTVANAAERFETGNKPWAAMERSRKGLAAAMKLLGFSSK